MKNGAVSSSLTQNSENLKTVSFVPLNGTVVKSSNFTIQDNARLNRVAALTQECLMDFADIKTDIKTKMRNINNIFSGIRVKYGNYKGAEKNGVNIEYYKQLLISAINDLVRASKDLIKETPKLIAKINELKAKCNFSPSQLAELDKLVGLLNGLPGKLRDLEQDLSDLQNTNRNYSSNNNQPPNFNPFQGVIDLMILIKQISDTFGKMPVF